jgi:hypothetical protein
MHRRLSDNGSKGTEPFLAEVDVPAPASRPADTSSDLPYLDRERKYRTIRQK